MDIDEQTVGNTFSWEKQYQKSWDVIQEDEDGTLSTSIDKLLLKNLHIRRIRSKHTPDQPTNGVVRRGIIRHIFLVIDASRSSLEETDFHPTRFACIIHCIESHFIAKFFQQNCLAKVGIVMLRNGIAEKICDLTSDSTQLIQSLRTFAKSLSEEEESFSRNNFPSLMNGVQIASRNLSLFSSKSCLFGEIIVLYGSIFTIDPDNLLNWTEENVKNGSFPIRISFVGMGGEMQIAKTITRLTHGRHVVPLNEHHIRDFLSEYIVPPEYEFEKRVFSLLTVGFPVQSVSDGGQEIQKCPRCLFPSTKGIPSECEVCNLLLVNDDHLSRSFSSLFVVSEFIPIEQIATDTSCLCFGCNEQITELARYQCGKCMNSYCSECDSLIHNSLQVCPGCSVSLGS